MTEREYLDALNDGLGDMDAEERADVILEMESHIDELREKSPDRTEAELVASLTPPELVARGILEGSGRSSREDAAFRPGAFDRPDAPPRPGKPPRPDAPRRPGFRNIIQSLVGSWGSRETVEIAQRVAPDPAGVTAFEFRVADVELVEGSGPDILVTMEVEVPEGESSAFRLATEATEGGVLYREDDPEAKVESVRLEIPRGLVVSVSTLSGDIDASCPCRSLELDTKSGDIDVEGAQGAVRAKSASGDVNVEEAEACSIATASGSVEVGRVGSCSVETQSGDVDVESARELGVKTASGDVDVGEVTERLGVSTASGDVDASCSCAETAVTTSSGQIDLDVERTGPGSIDVRSVSGDVSISLSGDDDVELRLASLSGDIEAFGEEAGRELSIRRGSAEFSVSVRTVSGDIDVE